MLTVQSLREAASGVFLRPDVVAGRLSRAYVPSDDLFDEINSAQQTVSIGDYDGGSVSRTRRLLALVDEEFARPAPVFVEGLRFEEPADVQWTECARWIKFKESAVEGGHRWSRPHVSPSSVGALLQARSCLQHGATMLGFDALNFPDVIDECIKRWEAGNALHHTDFAAVRKVFLAKKTHIQARYIVGDALDRLRPRREGDDGNRPSVLEQLVALSRSQSTSILPDLDGRRPRRHGGKKQKISTAGQTSAMKLGFPPTSTSDKNKGDAHAHMRRKLQEEAEGAIVLACRLHRLRRSCAAFVRLNTPSHDMQELSEVPEVPIRFIVILCTPDNSLTPIDDVLNAMGNLLSDPIFITIAYAAHEGLDLAHAVDEYLRHTVVLGPDKINLNEAIEPPMQAPKPLDRTPNQRRSSLLPSGHGDDDEGHHHPIVDEALMRTGRPFGGLINDVLRKLPFYASDYKDAFRLANLPQIISTTLFIYIVQLTNLVTYGTIMDHDLTSYHGAVAEMSIIETVMSGTICGIFYALFAGQPLNIISETGHAYIFETILNSYCKKYEWDFMAVRFWVGMWTAFFLLVVVATDGSALLAYVTRFSEEIFAALIALLFIVHAIDTLFAIGAKYPVYQDMQGEMSISPCQCDDNSSRIFPHFKEQSFETFKNNCMPATLTGEMCDYKSDVFTMSCLLFVGTFAIIVFLKWFKTTRFFNSTIRNTISDFSIFIAIICMTICYWAVGLFVPTLDVPTDFQPTSPHREWLINPWADGEVAPFPWWMPLASSLPALLLAILVIMDQHITAVIVNNPDHKLKKGVGYHLDLLLVSIMIVFCSIFGLPFIMAATVISISHVKALRVESENTAPGEVAQFLGIREQRVTALGASVLLGVSLLAAPIIDGTIPLPVLYGVFAYMGYASFDQQLVDRIMLFFMPTKHQPDHDYLRVVSLLRVHMFTVVQLACIGVLYAIKSVKAIKMAFPIMLVALVGIRKLLDYVYSPREMAVLDHRLPTWKELHTQQAIDKPGLFARLRQRLRRRRSTVRPTDSDLPKAENGGTMAMTQRHSFDSGSTSSADRPVSTVFPTLNQGHAANKFQPPIIRVIAAKPEEEDDSSDVTSSEGVAESPTMPRGD